ncbi:MAG: hypothetical protein WCJ30_21945 [Deltaproteobacteria bacterium]
MDEADSTASGSGGRLGAHNMWTIEVRMQADLAWQPIWSGKGGAVEQAARRRYEQVRDRINGHVIQPENVHSDRWVAARIARGGIVEEDHRAGADDTQPSLRTQPLERE